MSLKSRLSLLLPAALLVVAITLAGCNFFGQEPPNLPNPAQTTGQDVVTVFFSKNQGSQAITEEVVRRVPENAQDDRVQFALKELLKGPSRTEASQGFYSEIPKGTHLLDLKEKNGELHINLSSQFLAGGGSNSVQQCLEELTRTVFATDTQHKVYLAIDGKLLETLGGEGLEIEQPLQPQIQ